MTEIRIFVEGGGHSKRTQQRLREAFDRFLTQPKDAARERRIRWRLAICGGRGQTYRDFAWALRAFPEAFNVLLVDSEAAVARRPPEHLRTHDNWDCSLGTEENYHLMVQAMEAWLIADPEALALFYGPRFGARAIPKQQNVEEIPKVDLQTSLENATRGTQKGPYRKLDHGSALLGRIDPDKVRKRARHCGRLFAALTEVIQADP